MTLSTSWELSSLNGTNGFTINGASVGDLLGISVSDAGDINGDGIDDLIIGAPNGDPNGNSNAGETYIVFGKDTDFNSSLNVSSLNGANGFVIEGINSGDWSGESVSGAGDINEDGIDDLIIGATGVGSVNAGATYVVFGRNTSFSPTLNLSSLNGNNGFVLEGIDPFDYSGFSVSDAGDINGDNIDDLIIGAVYADGNDFDNRGESYVVFGKNTGFTSSLDLSTLDGTNGFILSGSNSSSGSSVSGAGDVNGDGIDDIIVFSNTNLSGTGNTGGGFVVFGRTTGFSANVDLSSLDSTNSLLIDGISPNGLAELYSVSGAGDVNNDAIDDVIVGYGLGDPNGEPFNNAGQSFVVFGRDGGFASGIDLSTLDGTNGFVINGINNNDQSGASVSGAGDVNGDGIDDIIVGARLAESNLLNSTAGQSYIIFGRDGGFAPSLNSSSLDGTNGFVFNGISGGDLSGRSVSGAGDVNNDGIDDIIIGATGADPNGNSQAGQSYVVFGVLSNEINGTRNSEFIGGTLATEVIRGLAGDDTINGGRGNDTLFGNAGSDLLRGNIDRDRLIGGAGNDTLFGNSEEDILVGNVGDDRLIGGTGDDNLIGSLGKDTLVGNIGNDRLAGGDDRDILIGGDGDDALIGGNGDDIFVIANNSGRDIIKDFAIGSDTIRLLNNLDFADLSFVGQRIVFNDNTLAVVTFDANLLSPSDFV